MRRKPKRVRSFDRRLWHRFWRIARPYWFGEQRWAAGGLLALLVLLLLGRTQFNVLFNQQTGEFTSALAAKDSERFWTAMQVFGLALLAAVPLHAVYYFVRDRLGLAWRRWLTADFLRRYFARRQFYELAGEEALDNPDQRIADDIQAFTQKSMLFLLELLSAVLTLVAFSGVLWHISKLLVGILVVYAVFGTVMTFGVFGKPMIGLNFQQLRREADFRFGLIRVRENAEAIAFYQGEARESAHIAERFAAVYENYKRLLRRTLGLDVFRYAYTFIPYALPSVVIASRIISGELEVGRAIQAGGAFAAMLSALTVFVDRFETLSAFAAGVERLHQLDRLLDKGAAPPPEQSSIESVEGAELALESVTLETPGTGRRLVEGVTLAVAPHADLVIVGQSGGGKSSLLRAIAGLWRRGSGTIVRPQLSQMLFLPQRPYMIWGSLREQLLYPNVDREVDEAELRDVLGRVNLPNLVERCGGLDAEQDFAKMLSIGEQQRVAVARVLLSSPRYAILDEATSALDAENEAMLYAELKRTHATLISVTHHPGLLAYHSQVLKLLGDGRWALHAAAGYGLAPELQEVDALEAAPVLPRPELAPEGSPSPSPKDAQKDAVLR